MQNNNSVHKTCQFYVQRKKRYCKFQVSANSTFCNVHDQNNENKILCPYEKQTYININQLEKHLEVCPKFKDKKNKQQSQWFTKGINSISKQQKSTEEINIKEFYIQKNQSFMNLLKKLPNLFFQVFQKTTQQNPLYFIDLQQQKLQINNQNKNSQISSQNKDLLQSKLLANLIQANKLLSLNNIYVQFGAGKGILSSSIANLFKFQHSKHILLEREARRNKFDRNFRENPFFQRYRSDVQDFNLSNIREIMINTIKQNPKFSDQIEKYEIELKQSQVVGVCKHMCGQATDLSIQALMNASDKIKIAGTVMATCCHHLCSYNKFLNKQFWKELNLNNLEVEMIFKLSSWGVLKNEGEYQQKIWQKDNLINELKQNIQELKNYQKIILGKMCKRMIDKARSHIIQNNLKKKVKIVRYCNQNITPQNFALIAYD